MKRLFCCTVLVFLLSTILYKVYGQTFDYGELKVTAGWGQLSFTESRLYLGYIDDSPSRDNMTAIKDIEQAKGAFAFSLGYSMGNYEGLHIDFDLDGQISQGSYLTLGVGGGYNFPVTEHEIIVRPNLQLAFGRASTGMGYLENNDLYIQINGQRFYQDVLSVRLSSFQIAAIPGVAFEKELTEKIGILMELGYQIRLSSGTPSIVFSGNTADGESASARESLKDPNVTFFSTTQSDLFLEMPFTINGLQVKGGIVIYL